MMLCGSGAYEQVFCNSHMELDKMRGVGLLVVSPAVQLASRPGTWTPCLQSYYRRHLGDPH